MKKVLLATTALTLSAGFASAEMAVTGFAEMGVFDADDGDGAQFHTDVDVTFTGTGTTDTGLTFGFSIDIDESIGDNNDDGDAGESAATRDDTQHGGASIFISGDFGTLTMGDTDGAYDWALTEIVAGGSIQDNAEHGGYNGNAGLDGVNDGQILRYDNTFGDFSFAISLEQDVPGTSSGDVFGLGVKGSFGDVSLGLGYQEGDNDDILGLSVGGDLGPVNLVFNWADQDSAADDYIGLGATYSEGPLTLHANFAENFNGVDGFGIHADYDLGGGAEVQFGYGSDDNVDTWSLGVAMSF